MDQSGASGSDEASTARFVDLTDDELMARIRHLEEVRRAGREEAGRMLAELRRRGRLSWPVIARKTGLRQTTAYELAERYSTADVEVERPKE